jgi:lipoprotein NlpD
MARTPGPGVERYILSLALVLPLAIVIFGLAQSMASPFSGPATAHADAAAAATASVKRPISSLADPPPTLAPPTATPRPTATPEPLVAPTATPRTGAQTYTVSPGDELKSIAADYNVSIWKIIAANDIPNPDSLKVGQVLKIPAAD